MKAVACTAQGTNRDLQAEGDLDDLQAAHQRLQGEHTALQQTNYCAQRQYTCNLMGARATAMARC
ncbi:hypothetical protein HaLaN_31411 [Haematococcus lacustris]|uniref:Uncharacterized protein n=1 Tax=Haematococcus lacustris TaxID=44745 RepID=A0A6A0AI73_HAELA|nr:hypothetical protein HaLaN_31411 [Haematococcus lacustris]